MGKSRATILFKVLIGIAVIMGILNAFIMVIDNWNQKK
jgi:hypothetical protein